MAAVMGAITIFLCAGLGIFVKFKATQTVTHEFKSNVENLNSMVSELLLDDIIVNNKNDIYDKILQVSKIHQDLASIIVKNRENEVLVDWRRSPWQDIPTLSSEKSIIVSGESFGKIISRWNLENTNNEIERRWKTVVAIAFGFFFIIAAHTLLAMKITLFNPLRKIEQRLASFSDLDIDRFLPASQWTSTEFNNIEAVADLLEQEIKARLAAEKRLQIAKNQANRANKAKSLFLANMSHELRTPLNAILGYSELLQEIAVENDAPEYIEDLKKIYRSGDYLLQLINGVLDLSKIEAEKVELNNTLADTCDIAQELVDSVRPLTKASNSNIVCNFNDHIKPFPVDTLRFRQILFNLLSNAAKFTRNGLIELSITLGQGSDEGFILYRVRDTGIGIAEEKLEQIFDDFVQANADTSHHYGGTGLGLTISKKLSRLMGGDIYVSSALGHGSTFTLKLPFKTQSPAQQKTA